MQNNSRFVKSAPGASVTATRLKSCRFIACCNSSSRHQTSDSNAAPPAENTPLIRHSRPSNCIVFPMASSPVASAKLRRRQSPDEHFARLWPLALFQLHLPPHQQHRWRHAAHQPHLRLSLPATVISVPRYNSGDTYFLAIPLLNSLDARRHQIARAHLDRRVLQVLTHAEREHDRRLRVAAHRERSLQPANEADHHKHHQNHRRQTGERQRRPQRPAKQISNCILPREQAEEHGNK